MKVNKIIICVEMNFETHLRKLEKAAMVAFMEMPISAKAKLNTKKLLGVRKSRILRKAITVTAFMKNPRRPSEHMREQIVRQIQLNSYITCITSHHINHHHCFLPSTSRHDPSAKTSSSANPSGKGEEGTISIYKYIYNTKKIRKM